MMKLILPIALLVVSTFVLTVRPLVTVSGSQSEDPIGSIRQSYARINRRTARYKKVKKDLSGFSAEGGELIAYFDGLAIVKLAATYYGEGGRSSEEYYYASGRLIFVMRRDYRYSRPLSGKVVRTTVSRFYFTNDKMIRWLDENGKQVAPDSSEFQDKQKEYQDSSKLFTDGARSKNRTIESNQ